MSASIIHNEDKGATEFEPSLKVADRTRQLLTLDFQTSHGPVWGGQRGAQQLIKPGLMAFTLAHNPKEESWRKKGQSSYNIREQEELRCGMLGMVSSLHRL